MQIERTFDEKIYDLLRSADLNLTIAQGIFCTLTALNEWPNESENDEEKSKEFAKYNYDFIFDFDFEYSQKIEQLESMGNHPALADLNELDEVSNALKSILLCIGQLGIQGTGGASKAGDLIIEKAKEKIRAHKEVFIKSY